MINLLFKVVVFFAWLSAAANNPGTTCVVIAGMVGLAYILPRPAEEKK